MPEIVAGRGFAERVGALLPTHPRTVAWEGHTMARPSHRDRTSARRQRPGGEDQIRARRLARASLLVALAGFLAIPAMATPIASFDAQASFAILLPDGTLITVASGSGTATLDDTGVC